MNTQNKCPFMHANLEGTTNKDWWPNQLDVSVLRQHDARSNLMDPDFDYREAFKTLDYTALKKDLTGLMTDLQEWWQLIMAIMAGFSFVWPGMLPAPIGQQMAAAAGGTGAKSVLPR